MPGQRKPPEAGETAYNFAEVLADGAGGSTTQYKGKGKYQEGGN